MGTVHVTSGDTQAWNRRTTLTSERVARMGSTVVCNSCHVTRPGVLAIPHGVDTNEAFVSPYLYDT